jgi:hypothetical protein
LFHRRASGDVRYAVLLALLFALTVYEGGVYPVPIMLVALGLDTLIRFTDRNERRPLLRTWAIFALLFPLLAAARLAPVIAYLREHPRLQPLDDRLSLFDVLRVWITRTHAWDYPPHPYSWGEYNDYVGVPVVLLLAVALAFAITRTDRHARERSRHAVLLIALLWFALGNIPYASVYALLHKLPIYRSLRVPSRYLYPATVIVALLAASTLTTVRKLWTERGVPSNRLRAFIVFEVILAVGVATDLCTLNGRRMQQGVEASLVREPAGTHFYQANGDYARIGTHPVLGIGTTHCYTPLDWDAAPGLWAGDVPQVRVEPSDAGQVNQVRWTANEITFDAILTRAGNLQVNQNYESGWRASVGRVWSSAGVLAVELPAGRRQVVLRHSPRWLGFGAIATMVGVVLAGGLCTRRVRRRFGAQAN